MLYSLSFAYNNSHIYILYIIIRYIFTHGPCHFACLQGARQTWPGVAISGASLEQKGGG